MEAMAKSSKQVSMSVCINIELSIEASFQGPQVRKPLALL
jgi:hypothetical protein